MSTGASWSTSFGGAAVSAMQVYDEVMGPRVFEPWARLLVEMLAIAPGEVVLDIACGPGPVARVAAQRAGPTGRVTACDLSAAMLAVARAKPPVHAGATITYLEGPADRLPVADEEFDVVTCQQGLQFFPDRGAAVSEMRRVLRPDGRVGIAVWTEVERSPAWSALADAIEQIAGGGLADQYRAGPWGFPDPAQLGALLEHGGFSDVRCSTYVLPLTFEAGGPQIVATLAASGIAVQIDRLRPDEKEQIVETLTRSIGAGPINSEMESNIIVARR